MLGFIVAGLTLSGIIYAAGEAAGSNSSKIEGIKALIRIEADHTNGAVERLKDRLQTLEAVPTRVDSIRVDLEKSGGALERVKERIDRLETIPNRLDRMTERMGELTGEVRALSTWLGVPQASSATKEKSP